MWNVFSFVNHFTTSTAKLILSFLLQCIYPVSPVQKETQRGQKTSVFMNSSALICLCTLLSRFLDPPLNDISQLTTQFPLYGFQLCQYVLKHHLQKQSPARTLFIQSLISPFKRGGTLPMQHITSPSNTKVQLPMLCIISPCNRNVQLLTQYYLTLQQECTITSVMYDITYHQEGTITTDATQDLTLQQEGTIINAMYNLTLQKE